jgi:hypothetical protein
VYECLCVWGGGALNARRLQNARCAFAEELLLICPSILRVCIFFFSLKERRLSFFLFLSSVHCLICVSCCLIYLHSRVFYGVGRRIYLFPAPPSLVNLLSRSLPQVRDLFSNADQLLSTHRRFVQQITDKVGTVDPSVMASLSASSSSSSSTLSASSSASQVTILSYALTRFSYFNKSTHARKLQQSLRSNSFSFIMCRHTCTQYSI